MIPYHIAYHYEVKTPGNAPPLAVGFADAEVVLEAPLGTREGIAEARRLLRESIGVEFNVDPARVTIILFNYWVLRL